MTRTRGQVHPGAATPLAAGRPAAGLAPPGHAPGPAAPGLRVPLIELTIADGLDHSVLPTVSLTLDRIVALSPRHLVIDLAGCPYLDATAIALLLDVHRQLWRADGLLSLRAPSPRLRRLLEVARVDHVLHIVPAGEPARGDVA